MKNQLVAITICICSIFITAFPYKTMAAEPRLTHLDSDICLDSKTGLMWQFGKSKSFKSMKKAVEYSENLTLASHSDWRLPTIDERNALKNIYDLQQNGDCDLVRLDSSFWTIGTKKGTQPGKLESNDQCGGDYDFVIKKKGYVRAVRP
jgi:hypothetical protein